MQHLAYLGEMERVDMRATVGYKLDDESKEARAFIFFGKPDPARSRNRTTAEHLEAARQHTDGVKMTNEKALAILTSPYCPGGFFEVGGAQPQPATAADAQLVNPASINATLTPVDAVIYDQPEDFVPAATQPAEPVSSGKSSTATPTP